MKQARLQTEQVQKAGVVMMTCTAAYLGEVHFGPDVVFIGVQQQLFVPTMMIQSRNDTCSRRVIVLIH